MKERPILFNGDMVRAILSGEKTQTRRMVRIQQNYMQELRDGTFEFCWDGGFDNHVFSVKCPFGQVGDRLWVRESATVLERMGGFRKAKIRYEADGAIETVEYPARLAPIPCVGYKLANGTYREASRITLEIVSVRVERLGGITDEDVLSEGFADLATFAYCWNSIYKNWRENPWVWVVAFKMVEVNQ